MAVPFFARTTLLLACLLAPIAAISSVNAQVYIDNAVEEMAQRQGRAKELEAKRQMFTEVQVSPSNIELRELDGGTVYLAPYVTIDLGEQASQTEWMINKTPPVFIATVKDFGAIIFSVLPNGGPEVSNERLYQKLVDEFRGKFKTLEASPFRQLSETQGEGTMSGQHANGNTFQAYLHFVHQPDFVLMVQGFGNTAEKLKDLERIIHTMKIEPTVPSVTGSTPESSAFIPYGSSRLRVPNPQGLVRGTHDFPQMVAEINSQSPIEVNEVFVLPTATEASWQVNGLYRGADARAAGSMTSAEFDLLRKELEAAAKQRVSITPEVKITGIVNLDDSNVFCYTQRVQLPLKTRIGVSAVWFHEGQLFQFCLYSDARTPADETWATETMKDWLRSIRQANSNSEVAAK